MPTVVISALDIDERSNACSVRHQRQERRAYGGYPHVFLALYYFTAVSEELQQPLLAFSDTSFASLTLNDNSAAQ